MATAFDVIIPARLNSTRLPGKALADLAGEPMVVHVARRAALSGARRVIVATDDTGIAGAVEAKGFTAVLTGSHHATGTDRLAEVVAGSGFEPEGIVVNVQGDEPLIEPSLIRHVADNLVAHARAAIATAAHPFVDRRLLLDPNVVKVVTDRMGYAHYFSRAPIPWPRDDFAVAEAPQRHTAWRHVGIYAYRVAFLRQYPTLSPSPLESVESLEQLRALYHGFAISVAAIDGPAAPGVDTPEDLERVRQILAASALRQSY